MNEKEPNVEDEAREPSGEDKAKERFMATAIRGPSRGALEDAVTHTLFLSIGAEPLRSIYLVTKGALMFGDEELQRLGIDPERVRVMNTVANSLSSYIDNTVKTSYVYREQFMLAWGFEPTRENYETYILPWWRGDIHYYPDRLRHCRVKHLCLICCRCGREMDSIPKSAAYEEMEAFAEKWGLKKLWNKARCPHCGFEDEWEHGFSSGHKREERTKILHNPEDVFFFDATTYALSRLGYEELKNAFIHWALAHAQKMLTVLLQTLPSSKYREMMDRFLKERREAGEEQP